MNTVYRQTIVISEVKLEADIGIERREFGVLQPLILDIVIETKRAFEDELEATIDYRAIVLRAHEIVGARRFSLLETLAWRLVDCYLEFPGALAVEVLVRKPEAIPPAVAAVRAAAYPMQPCRTDVMDT